MSQVKQSVLTINAGSSSIKFALYQLEDPRVRTLSGKIDRIGLPGTQLTFRDISQDPQGRSAVDISERRQSAPGFVTDWSFSVLKLNKTVMPNNEDVISAQAGRVTVRLICTDEEQIIATMVVQLLRLAN